MAPLARPDMPGAAELPEPHLTTAGAAAPGQQPGGVTSGVAPLGAHLGTAAAAPWKLKSNGRARWLAAAAGTCAR